MSTALTVYYSNTAASALATANKLYIAGGSPTISQKYSRVGTATGYGEIVSQGTTTAWAALGAIGSPTGKGFLLDDTSLEGQTIQAGTWSAQIRLNCAQGGDVSPQQGTLVGTIFIRAFKRSSGGVYTQIVSMSLSTTIDFQFTTFTSFSGSGAATAFASGEKLYTDAWFNVTTNANGVANQDIRLNRLSTDTSGLTGFIDSSLTSPGYLPTSGGGSSPGRSFVNGLSMAAGYIPAQGGSL